MTEHTATPYIYDDNTAHAGVFDIYGIREDGEYDPKVAEAFDEATAHFIVTACNNHLTLFETCLLVDRAWVGDGVSMAEAVNAVLLAINKVDGRYETREQP